MEAAFQGQLAITKVLMKAGADVTIRDEVGECRIISVR
jgi:hypothetical protein